MFFKEVQLISILHSETNDRKRFLKQKKKTKPMDRVSKMTDACVGSVHLSKKEGK